MDRVRCINQRKQFALEIDHMAACVRSGTKPRTSGDEGLQDHLLMAALYESARAYRPATVQATNGIDVFRGPMPKASGRAVRLRHALRRLVSEDR